MASSSASTGTTSMSTVATTDTTLSSSTTTASQTATYQYPSGSYCQMTVVMACHNCRGTTPKTHYSWVIYNNDGYGHTTFFVCSQCMTKITSRCRYDSNTGLYWYY
jgi:hypothetical protein